MKKLQAKVNFLFALLLILTMQTIYVKLVGVRFDLLLNFLFVLVGVFSLWLNRENRVGKESIMILATQVLLFLTIPLCHFIFLRHQGLNYSATILVVLQMLLSLTICTLHIFSIGVIPFLESLENAIFYLTCISFPLYIFGQVLRLIPPSNTVTYKWGGLRQTSSYFYLNFNAQGSAYHSFQNGRFTGIFTEAPMCAFVLCVGLIICLFIIRKKLFLHTAVLSTAIYFTASTTGWIISILAFFCFFALHKEKNKYTRLLKYIVAFILMVLASRLTLYLFDLKQQSDITSVSIRNNNFLSAIEDFTNSPIFGFGFKSDAIGVTGGNTSAISVVLQQGGILFFIWYFAPIIISICQSVYYKQYNVLFALGLYTLLLFTTVVTYTSLSVAIIVCCVIFVIHNTIRKGKTVCLTK